jgi:TldD protein
MKDLASWALDTATQRGAAYADVRVVDERGRALATKNAKIGNASDSRSQGFNVRVLVDGAWGFASSADLGRVSVDATAAQAVAIARASAKVKQKDVQLVPEKAVTAEWTTPHKIDPFSISI